MKRSKIITAIQKWQQDLLFSDVSFAKIPEKFDEFFDVRTARKTILVLSYKEIGKILDHFS